MSEFYWKSENTIRSTFRLVAAILVLLTLSACSDVSKGPENLEDKDTELAPTSVVVGTKYYLPRSYGAQPYVVANSFKRDVYGRLYMNFTSYIDNRQGRYAGQMEVYYNSRWNYVQWTGPYTFTYQHRYISNFPGYRVYFRYCSFVYGQKRCPSQAYLAF